MRMLVMFLALLGCVALFVIGVPSVLVGIAEQRHVDDAYVVGYVPGASCDDAHELYLRTEDAAILDCVSAGISFASGRISLPGFTDEQNARVETLKDQLGQDGLSGADRREIQDTVDQLAATVPPDVRPYGDQWVLGAGRAWLGGGMIVVAVLGVIATFRFGPPKSRQSRS
jgi:hypothetical protein